jgi:hypothetical protein
MSNITSNRTTKAAALAGVLALIAGTQKHFPNGQFTLGKTAYTTASLGGVFQELADAYSALSAAHAMVKDAVLAVRTTEANVDPIIGDYVNFLRATFRNAAAELGDFGLQPPRARTPLVPEKRLTATAKAKATRIARGTMGKKQKSAIKGDVTGVIVTPVTASGAPSVGATASASTAIAPSVVAK